MAWEDPSSVGSFTAIASGTLSNGATVVVNSDGTVSAAGLSSTYSNSGSVGSQGTFVSANPNPLSATFDSNSNKVVIGYVDNGNSAYGTAVVGTVSGTGISFGTPVVFKSASTGELALTFDSNSNKVVIAYSAATAGEAIVGTVSGTSISFGTAVQFAGTVTYSGYSISSTFDSSSNKVVFSYRGTSGYYTAIVGTVSGTSISFGTATVYKSLSNSKRTGIAHDSNANKIVIGYSSDNSQPAGIVGTVSGTSISFGTETIFDSATIASYISVIFDSNANKTVFTYKDIDPSFNFSRGASIVGTVSGTGISFGTKVVWHNPGGMSTDDVNSAYNSTANKVVVGYQDEANSNYGALVVGEVSGTSISFGSEVTFNSVNQTRGLALVFDSNLNKIVINYYESVGRSSVFTITSSSTSNLTAENYIGISNGAYANSATATIQTVGSVDDAQSGLTAGQSYYVQGDGTLSTSAGSPSVFAGTAVAATKLIIKG